MKFGGFLIEGDSSSSISNKNKKLDESDQKQTNKTKDDLIKDLNSESKNEIQWEWEGEKIYAKSINVARLSKTKLLKNMVFNRVKRVIHEAQFKKKFSLSTDQSLGMV